MRIVDNPRKILRRFSFISLGSISTLQAAWQASEAFQAVLPAPWVQGITLALGALGLVGAFIDQPKAK